MPHTHQHDGHTCTSGRTQHVSSQQDKTPRTPVSLTNHTRSEPDVPVSGFGSCLKPPTLLLGLAAHGSAQGVISAPDGVLFLCPSALITLPQWYLHPSASPGKPRCAQG